MITTLDINKIRAEFPILSRKVNGKDLIYFDNAATTQKPIEVIEAIVNYYTNQNSNIHRGVHTLSRELTYLFESAREKVKEFIGATNSNEVVFTKGTTESINLVANGFEAFISSGDELLISEMEHHSNILPWQFFCHKKGATLKVIPVNELGEIDLNDVEKAINEKTKLLAVTHVSNTLGTINPVKEIINLAHRKQIPVLIDGAQAIPHLHVNVQELDADFYTFSAHKMYGPTGIGVVYIKEKWLNSLAPYQLGGGIIKTVTFEKAELSEAPLKFEAGTPNIEGVIGMASAIKYLNRVGMQRIAEYENELLNYATEKIKSIEDIIIIGNSKHKAAVISFVVKGLNHNDIGTLLDEQGIAVRTGHHCTQPLLRKYGLDGTIRASFSHYNTFDEIDSFVVALSKAIKMLR